MRKLTQAIHIHYKPSDDVLSLVTLDMSCQGDVKSASRLRVSEEMLVSRICLSVAIEVSSCPQAHFYSQIWDNLHNLAKWKKLISNFIEAMMQLINVNN